MVFRSPRLLLALASLAALPIAAAGSSCGDDPEIVNAVPPDDGPPDAAPDAPPDVVDSGPVLPTLGPSLVLDDMHIATLMEDPHAFSLLGAVVNEQLKAAIQGGTWLLGLELRALDDPAGQDDPMLTVGMYGLSDTDGDASDNFNADAPEQFTVSPLSTLGGSAPVIHFSTALVSGGVLHAESVDLLSIPGLPIPFQNPTIDGTLVPTADGEHVRGLQDGRLSGVIPASVLALVPNITMGTCKGSTLLDVIATGCGFFGLQPEVDLDGDGLEKLFDDGGGDPEAGSPKDGVIDRCVDGDGTEILGTDCASDARIQDGYRLIFAIHGVRAIILEP